MSFRAAQIRFVGGSCHSTTPGRSPTDLGTTGVTVSNQAFPNPTSITDLGTHGGIRYSIARTDEPWRLPIDAAVVSVGSGLGSLGGALRTIFVDAAWSDVPYDSIDSGRPHVLVLPPPTGTNLLLRRAVLVNPREEPGEYGEVTDDSLRAATESALAAAASLGARAIGLPLLSAGLLGKPVDHVAEVIVPAAVSALRVRSGRETDRLVFLCQSDTAAEILMRAFTRAVTNSATLADAPLAGGISSDLVDPNIGIPLRDDHLGVAPYVSMLATVVADRATPLPLSIGVFGEWGSGKSYFMALLRDRIRSLSESGSDQYCQEIVQIGFNAWHYADSNLWASLGDEIFRQLAGGTAASRDRAEQIRVELTERLDQRHHLEAATRQARETAARLQTEVDRAVDRREMTARNLLAALSNSSRFGKDITLLWRQLGIADEKERADLLAGQLHDAADDTKVLARASLTRAGRISLALAVALVGLGVLVPLIVSHSASQLAWVTGLVTTLTGAGGVTVLLGRVHAGLRTLRRVREDLRSEMRTAAESAVGTEMAETLTRLRGAEAERRVAQAQLDDVITHVGELGRQLAELDPGRRLYSFLADRAGSDSYSAKLGLISTIRKDFQQLVQLMEDWRRNPDPSGDHRPIDRIVLYIDDLDRCSPDQVVDVIQAVHLLLALDLFVVVVGVDPRWLMRSLRTRYAALLRDGANDPEDQWHTPDDYLEKILNIPMVLPRMSPDGVSRLLHALGDPQPSTASAPAPVPRADPPAAPPAVANSGGVIAMDIEPGSEVDVLQHAVVAPEPPRPLTDPELTLLTALDMLVDTPREAKRLLNLYRMVRATRDLSPASRFLGMDGRAGEFEAVILLLGLLTAHASLLSEVLDMAPDPANSVAGGLTYRSPDTELRRFVADFEPRPAGSELANGIIGVVPKSQVPKWYRLHSGLVRLTAQVTFTDLSGLHTWLPRVRRFCYTLTPDAVAPPVSVAHPNGRPANSSSARTA